MAKKRRDGTGRPSKRDPSNDSYPPKTRLDLLGLFWRGLRRLGVILVSFALFVPVSYALSDSGGALLAMLCSTATFFITNWEIARTGRAELHPFSGCVAAVVSGLEAGVGIYFLVNFPVGVSLGLVVGLVASVNRMLLFLTLPSGAKVDRIKPAVELRDALIFPVLYCLVALMLRLALLLLRATDIEPFSAFRVSDYLALFAVSVVVAIPGYLVFGSLGVVIRNGLLFFAELLPIIRITGKGLVGFAVGYLVLALVFATWHWFVWSRDPSGAFHGLPKMATKSSQFFTFLYYSVVTIGTLGYGDITPKSGWAKALSGLELISGIAWITVIFALMMAHYQEQLARLSAFGKAKRDEEPPQA